MYKEYHNHECTVNRAQKTLCPNILKPHFRQRPDDHHHQRHHEHEDHFYGEQKAGGLDASGALSHAPSQKRPLQEIGASAC